MTDPVHKPGKHTTEFYLALAAKVLGALMVAGVFDEEAADPTVAMVSKLAGVALVVLAALGYTAGRSKVKAAAAAAGKAVKDNAAILLLVALPFVSGCYGLAPEDLELVETAIAANAGHYADGALDWPARRIALNNHDAWWALKASVTGDELPESVAGRLRRAAR